MFETTLEVQMLKRLLPAAKFLQEERARLGTLITGLKRAARKLQADLGGA